MRVFLQAIIYFTLFTFHNAFSSSQTQWTKISPNFISAETVNINSQGDIFVGTFFDGIYRSTDDGSSWVQVYSDNGQKPISKLAVNHQDQLFLGTKDFGVWTSIDNGFNWVQTPCNLAEVSDIEINSEDDIFAANIDNGGGIYRSTDNGNSWDFIRPDTTVQYITTIFITGNNEIYCGTIGSPQ